MNEPFATSSARGGRRCNSRSGAMRTTEMGAEEGDGRIEEEGLCHSFQTGVVAADADFGVG